MQPSPPCGTAVGIVRTEILQRTKHRVAAVLREKDILKTKRSSLGQSEVEELLGAKDGELAARFQNEKCFAGGICQRRKRFVKTIAQQLTRLHRRHRRVWACLIFFDSGRSGLLFDILLVNPCGQSPCCQQKKKKTPIVTIEKAANTANSQ